MIAHGIWDFSTFLDANNEQVAGTPRGIIGASKQPTA